MTESVAARLKALEENYNKRGALAELAAICAEVEAIAKEMRSGDYQWDRNAGDWADRLASEGK